MGYSIIALLELNEVAYKIATACAQYDNGTFSGCLVRTPAILHSITFF